jgi:DNA polymerase-1
LGSDLSDFSVDAPFCYCEWVEFNPSSHKQIIEVLNSSGWSPTDKTDTHIETERELAKRKRLKRKLNQFDIPTSVWEDKLRSLEKTGWKVNEANLSTLPDDAPSSAKALAHRILLEARRRTLTEWLGLVEADGRIHGQFYGIGAWTHRMSHQRPNTANIPNEFDTAGKTKLLGKEMRSLWCAPENRLLVGVDAEGIQLRIFAHLIDDEEFTDALVRGRKDDKTDPHSLNQRILGDVCKSRAAAKRFIYALLLGAGVGKLGSILGCGEHAARASLDRLMERYTGFQLLKDTIIPQDARRGWFFGLDGRQVVLPGDDEGYRRHLCMSGYLQAGEAVIMKKACLLWQDQLRSEGILDWLLVNFVHDEWQTEVPLDFELAKRIAEIQCESLRIVGEQLKLKCPLAGSYWNDDHKDFTIGRTWSVTH